MTPLFAYYFQVVKVQEYIDRLETEEHAQPAVRWRTSKVAAYPQS